MQKWIIGAMLILSAMEGEVISSPVSDLATQHNFSELIFDAGGKIDLTQATPPSKDGIIDLGSKTSSIINLDGSNLGESKSTGSDQQVYLKVKGDTPLKIENYGKSTKSQWVIGINIAESTAKLKVTNRAGALWGEAGVEFGDGGLELTNEKGARMNLGGASFTYKDTSKRGSNFVFTNYGSIIGSDDGLAGQFVNINGKSQVTIQNLGSQSEISGFMVVGGDSTASTTTFTEGSKVSLYNEGHIETRNDSSALIGYGLVESINRGVIVGGIATGRVDDQNGAIFKGEGRVDVLNYGTMRDKTHTDKTNKTTKAHSLILSSAGNRLQNLGDVETVKFIKNGGNGSTSPNLSVQNSGLIAGYLVSGVKAEAKISGDTYSVRFGSKMDYEKQGAVKVEFEGSNGGSSLAFNFVNGTKQHFTLRPSDGFDFGKPYDVSVDKFFKNASNGGSGTIDFKSGGTDIKAQLDAALPRNLSPSQSIYKLETRGQNIVVRLDANGSVGALRNLASVAVFDSLRRHITKLPSSSPSSALPHSPSQEEDPKALDESPQLWELAILPYFIHYDLASVQASGLGGGFVGGGARSLEGGISLGFHLGLEYGSFERRGEDLQALRNISTILGLHTEIPFDLFEFDSMGLTPYLSAQATVLFSQQMARLSVRASGGMQEDSGLSVGGNLSLQGGVSLDFASYGNLKSEVGLSQTLLSLPNLSFHPRFELEQRFSSKLLTPLDLSLKAIYSKSFALSSLELIPRAALGGKVRFFPAQNLLEVKSMGQWIPDGKAQALGTGAGLLELGLDMRLSSLLSFALSYVGEYGTELYANGLDFRLNFRF